MWMLKHEAATFRPPVHMLGHQTSHQSDHAHPLGRPGRNGGLPCRLLWRRMLKLASGWTQLTVASCHEFGPGLSRYHSQLQLKDTETFFHWMPSEADETWQNIYPTPNVSKSSHHSCPNALETCRDFVSFCHAQSSWQICAFPVSCRFFTNPVAALRFVLDFPGVRFGTHILGC